MPAPFRLAFLGIDNPHGHGWRELLRHFSDEVEIVAIVPGFGGQLTSLEEHLARVPRFDDVAQLVASGPEFDGAVVCLPNDSTPQDCAALALAGKHILAEKPVAGSAERFRPVAAAIRKSGVAFQAGYMWRYDECATRLREMVRDNRFGKHISTEITFVTSDVQRRDPGHYLFDAGVSEAGFFNWLACHSLDLLLYILQQPVVGVTARAGVFGGTAVEVEDGGVAIMDLADGSLATFLGGYWIPRWAGESRWCLRGSQRWVNWDPGRQGTSGVLEIHGPMPQWIAMEETFSTPADTTPGYGGARGRALVRDWLDAAQSGRTDCRNTPESVLATLELIDTIYRASREGRRIECRIGS
jgi:predicted dehydrogenase